MNDKIMNMSVMNIKASSTAMSLTASYQNRKRRIEA